MRIAVFGAADNPAVDRPFLRKSFSFCETEVRSGRADQVDADDIRKGIRLKPVRRVQQVEARGSKESTGSITAHEMQINTDYRGPHSEVHELSRQYEHELEKHILKGKSGTPRMCDVIAARVKVILSDPAIVL